MTDMPTQTIRFGDIPANGTQSFSLEPDAAARATLADALNVPALKRLRFAGTLSPRGRGDWTLKAELGATVQQACVVTLAPITTRIDEHVVRHYVRDWSEPEGEEVEMPEDTSTEPMPATIDLNAVVLEALTLAIPAYPRAEGAELEPVRAAPEGVKPLSDEDLKPFAGLAGLRDQLAGNEDGEN